VLLGGEGRDQMTADRGLDILVGGEGGDYLSGGDDEDLIVAGDVNEADDIDTALADHLAEWVGNPEMIPGGLSTVGDDGERDNVIGGRGTDVMYASLYLPPFDSDPLSKDSAKATAKEFETILPEG
jgi:hypothetical protein